MVLPSLCPPLPPLAHLSGPPSPIAFLPQEEWGKHLQRHISTILTFPLIHIEDFLPPPSPPVPPPPPFKFSKGKQEADWEEEHWFEFHIDRFSKWISPGQSKVSEAVPLIPRAGLSLPDTAGPCRSRWSCPSPVPGVLSLRSAELHNPLALLWKAQTPRHRAGSASCLRPLLPGDRPPLPGLVLLSPVNSTRA